MRPAKQHSKGILLADSDGVLTLALRSTDLAQELCDLPSDGQRLFERLLAARGQAIESQYESVCMITRLDEMKWRPEGYESLSRVLAELGLPTGKQLAKSQLVARMFSRETILLCGFQALGFLLMTVANNQSDKSKRRSDIASILALYSKRHEDFNQASFYRAIADFKAVYYKAAQSNGHRVERQASVKIDAKPSAPIAVAPVRSNGDHGGCLRCLEKQQRVTASLAHIERLESFIADNLGAKFIPARPQILKRST